MLPEEIVKGVYLVGRATAQDRRGCHVYLLDFGELVLIDAGTGKSFAEITASIGHLGFEPRDINTIILTHCHVDHSGGARQFSELFGSRLIMHELDAPVVEQGDNRLSAGHWFNVHLTATPIDVKLAGEYNILRFNRHELHCLHTPGHSPGSLSLYTDISGKRILFGQDLHAPILEEYRSCATDWRSSMEKLLALNADVLCEGHLGVIAPAGRVSRFIEKCLSKQTGLRPPGSAGSVA